MTLGEMLTRTAAEHPHKTVLMGGGESMTYQSLEESASRLARWFVRQGLLPGDRGSDPLAQLRRHLLRGV